MEFIIIIKITNERTKITSLKIQLTLQTLIVLSEILKIVVGHVLSAGVLIVQFSSPTYQLDSNPWFIFIGRLEHHQSKTLSASFWIIA